jgi:histidinol-phosphatase
MDMNYERELTLAKALAEEAGRIAIEYQTRGVTAEEKSDESPVTAADRACEQLIVEGITKEFPDDGILGEEGANRESRNGRKWIVDPIDGTRDFVRGIPLWAILIGLEVNGEVVAGVAYSPGQRLLLWAGKGQGAWSNGQRLFVADKTNPSQAVLCFNGFNKAGVGQFAPALLQWVADVWIEPNAQPWDLAALKILVEEAGGVFGTFDGGTSIYGGNAWACVPGLAGYVRQLLDGRQAD